MPWGQALRNWGQAATSGAAWGAAGRGVANVAMGRRGVTAASALWGGGAGALYGMAAEDTSMLGGMAGGAALGAGGWRYGARPGIAANRAMRMGGGGFGLGARMHGQAVRNAVTRDYRGASLAGNRAINRVGSSLKGWTEGPMNAYGYMF